MHELGYAEQLYRSLIKERPNYTDAYMRLGALAEGRGNAKDASMWYKEALTVFPQLADAYTALAKLHVGGHDFQAAQSKLEKILQKDNLDAYASITLGNIYLNNARIDKQKEKDKDKEDKSKEKFKQVSFSYVLGLFRLCIRVLQGQRQGLGGQVQGQVQAGQELYIYIYIFIYIYSISPGPSTVTPTCSTANPTTCLRPMGRPQCSFKRGASRKRNKCFRSSARRRRTMCPKYGSTSHMRTSCRYANVK